MMLSRAISSIFRSAIKQNRTLCKGYLILPTSYFHKSYRRCDLMEFFDKKDTWSETSITVGRPWKNDELRLKSNGDLHKLWYVLLKERNMLMTMEKEYARLYESFPNPERLEKVEESMENLLEVIQERDQAYHELETGEKGEPGRRWVYNELGIGHWRQHEEHTVPIHMHPTLKHSELPSTHRFKWAVKFKKLYREKELKKKARLEKEERDKAKYLEKRYTKHQVD